MSTKLVIACPGRPAINGHHRRKFTWMPEYNAYVYEGRVLDEREVNAIAEVVVKKNTDLHPYMKVVQFSEEKTETSAPIVQQTVHTTDPTPPAARPITLDQALDVVQKLAPEKLKKAPGKKPVLEAV